MSQNKGQETCLPQWEVIVPLPLTAKLRDGVILDSGGLSRKSFWFQPLLVLNSLTYSSRQSIRFISNPFLMMEGIKDPKSVILNNNSYDSLLLISSPRYLLKVIVQSPEVRLFSSLLSSCIFFFNIFIGV